MGRHKLIEDDELLAKARTVFVRDGMNVGSRKIAREIGISSSVLFQRFGSMQELFFAAMSPPMPDMALLLARDKEREHASVYLERITLGLLDYFRRLVPVLTPLAMHPSFNYPAFTKRHPNSPMERIVAGLLTTLEDKDKKGEIDCPDVGSVVLNLVATAYGLAMLERMGVHDGEFSDGSVKALARLLWRSITPSGPPAKAKQRPRARARR